MSAGKNDMTHRQKVKRLIADLRKQGMSPYTVAPPLFRLLWALGFKVPPPLFLGFLTLTLLTGASFGILWGVVMWQLQWQAWHVPLGLKVIIATGVGLMFGLYMATYFRWKAKHLRLPPWDSYPREYQQVATRAEKGEVEILQRPRQMNFVLGKNVIMEDIPLLSLSPE
jgi:hypothetical protein